LRWALSDLEGRTSLGVPPPTGQAAIRNAATARLPWTLYVSASPGAGIAGLTSRQRLLLLVFGVLAAVLFAGAYFILRAISRELRVARLQSDFVAAVSHEFRSPLSSLCQISEMLARDRFPTEELRRKSYTVLESESQRLRRLVESVLDFGRIQAGAYGYHFEPLELCSFTGSLVEAFQAKVAADGYRVERSGDAPEVYVQADREALSRALWNLLDNAVKYSPECRTVWVEIGRQEGSVTVTVRDQGIGIPPHEQREIFNKFVRGAESKARSIKGTGIGLAMVREIVRAHGGEIRVSSEPGHGSRFTMKMRTAGGLP
jgi:signal transduction histidine kinase